MQCRQGGVQCSADRALSASGKHPAAAAVAVLQGEESTASGVVGVLGMGLPCSICVYRPQQGCCEMY